jgi:hypothetical protein
MKALSSSLIASSPDDGFWPLADLTGVRANACFDPGADIRWSPMLQQRGPFQPRAGTIPASGDAVCGVGSPLPVLPDDRN